MHNEWLYEGVSEIAERTQQAVLLQGRLRGPPAREANERRRTARYDW